MRKVTALILLLTAFGAGIARAEVIQIANGDVAGIVTAIHRANETGKSTTLQLAEHGRYKLTSEEGFPVIYGDLRIMGNGATFTTAGGRVRTKVFQIDQSGSVLIFEVFFSQIVVSSPLNAGFIFNKGTLLLRSTSFNEIHLSSIKDIQVGLIFNKGDLTLENVSIGNISVSSVLGDFFAVLIFNNYGSVSIKNSTLLSSDEVENPALWNFNGSFDIGSSILANTTGAVCFGNFSSDGPNLISDETCELAQTLEVSPDQMGISTNISGNGGRVPTFPIDNAASPAVDAGDNASCLSVDARGFDRPTDGDSTGAAICDLGAFEFNAVSQAGRFNGLFFDPASDGHYVTLQRSSEDKVLVVWNTFDANGTQAWVFGVGKLHGNQIEVADVFQSVGGILEPDGSPQGQGVIPWGRIDVELTSCQGGSFRYQANRSGFGSGEFSLERLASIDGLSCLD